MAEHPPTCARVVYKTARAFQVGLGGSIPYAPRQGNGTLLLRHLLLKKETDFVAHVLGYFDESGKFKDQEIVCFAGYVAGWKAVEAFDGDWSYWLRRFGLDCLTMKHALNHRVRLSDKTDARGPKERITVLMNFADCILKHFEFGTSVAVDVKAFESLSSEPRRVLGKNPHYMAFSRVLGEIKKHYRGELKIALVCDDEEAYSMECYRLYRKLKAQDAEARKPFTSIAFGDDADHTQLQAADMLASLTRLEAARQINQAPYEYQALTAHLMSMTQRVKYEVGIFSKPSLSNLAATIIQEQRKGKPLDPITIK